MSWNRAAQLLLTTCSVLWAAGALSAQGAPPQVADNTAAAQPPALSLSALGSPVAQPVVSLETTSPRSARSSSGPIFAALYSGFAATQVMDVHSTLRALDAGHQEGNPMMRWAASNPVALVSLKVAATAGTMAMVQQVRRKHPKGAMFLLAALDTAYALVVAHNYQAPIPGR